MAARDVLKQALPKAAPMSLGLTAYGHRRTGDCSDVEVAVPLAKSNAERIATYLDKYNPKGKGPLGNALKSRGRSDDGEGGQGRAPVHDRHHRQRRQLQSRHMRAVSGAAPEPSWTDDPRHRAGRLQGGDSAAGMSGHGIRGEAVQGGSGHRNRRRRRAEFEDRGRRGSWIVTPRRQRPVRKRPLSSKGRAVDKPAQQKPPEPAGPPGLRLTALLAAGGAEITSGVRWRITDAAARAASGASSMRARIRTQSGSAAWRLSRGGESSAWPAPSRR